MVWSDGVSGRPARMELSSSLILPSGAQGGDQCVTPALDPHAGGAHGVSIKLAAPLLACVIRRVFFCLPAVVAWWFASLAGGPGGCP